jgi:DNA processing protein
LGTAVVEADGKSGALITAKHANEQGRDIFAIPGNIDSPLSEGTTP